MNPIPSNYADLLERPLFGHLGTVKPDGTPQVTPIWFQYDGELLYFTTATNRAKYAFMRANPNVALSVNDPEQPYRYIEVRGVVESLDPDEGGAQFDALAARYGLPLRASQLDDLPQRVRVVVRPVHCTFQG